ncbi:hypothetical protein D3C74_449980 [compost metagenome]
MGLAKNSAVFDRIFSCTPYGGNYTFLTLDSTAGDLIKAIGVSAAFIIVILAITFAIFRRSEMK